MADPLKLVRDVAERWNLLGVHERISQIEADPKTIIGFLGDFSSGKSTLINELVGIDDLMPARVEPCTASAGLVYAVDGLEEPEFFRLSDRPDPGVAEELAPIGRIEFDDLARGVVPGRPVAYVRSSASFPSGFVFADTPGLGSLVGNHESVTMGELPFLDAALLCIDIQKGGLTKPIADFLRAPGVRHLSRRFVVALTHADSMSVAQREEVRCATTAALATVIDQPESDVRNRVAVVSAGPDSSQRNARELTETLDREVVARRTTLLSERRQRQAGDMLPYVRDVLRHRRSAIAATDPELEQKHTDLQSQVESAKLERKSHRKRLEEFGAKLRREVERKCAQSRDRFAAAKDAAEITAASKAFSAALSGTISRSVGEFAADFGDNVDGIDESLKAHIASMNRGADVAKTVTTAALTAWLFPGVGVAGNAAEAGGGALARGAGAVGAKKLAGQAAKKAAKQSLLKTVVGGLLKAVDDINPVNYLGDLLAEQVKRQTVEAHLAEISADVTANACSQLDQLFEEQYFSVIESRLSTLATNLAEAEKERRAAHSELRSKLVTLDADITALTMAMRS